jgi:4-amino-4-deoxy-L-arabinose transferase-like glycosyltransferase
MLVALGLRASDLRADPPPDLSWSFAPYTDEGLNTYSARNMALYGTWKADDFLPFVIYPLVNALVALVFKLFGIGFVQMKVVSVLAGAMGVLVMYLLMKETAGSLAGLFAGLGLATCYPLVMYSRLGLVETVQVLFLLCVGLFWVKGLRHPWLMLLCGFFAAATVLLVKISAAFIGPVMLVLFTWELLDLRRDVAGRTRMYRGILWFAAGVFLASVFWFIAVFLPYRTEYFRYVLRHSTESPAGHPHGVPAYLLNTFTLGVKARLLPRLIWPALLGFIMLPFLAAGRRPGMRYLLLWFVFGLLMLGYMNYRPPRYEMVLIPVLLAGFAAALGRLLEEGTLVPRMNPTLLKTLALSLWLWPLATQLLLYATRLRSMPRPGAEAGVLMPALIVALGVAVAGFLLSRAVKHELRANSLAGRAAVAAVLVLPTLRLDFGQYFDWFSTRTHNMVEWSKELTRSLPENAVVGGGWAPILLSESRLRALAVTDWANRDDPIGRHHVTHIASLEDGPDIRTFLDLYPDLGSRLSVFRRFEVRGYALVVYSVAQAPDSVR